jgi:hypothetical protein
MDNKTASTVGIALLACIALMLTVIGGLYGYNTFAGNAQPVYAQVSSPTDRGANWTVSTVSPDGNKQFIVVITQGEVAGAGIQGATRQMSIYELSSRGNARAQLWFVAARVLEYDAKLAEFHDQDASRRWGPQEVKAALPK